MPNRQPAIMWTNDYLLLIGPLGTHFSEIVILIQKFSYNKMNLKMLHFVPTYICYDDSGKWESKHDKMCGELFIHAELLNSQKTSHISPVRGELWGVFSECFVRRLTQYFALWTHKRYPIFRPKGRVMGCLFLILCQKTDLLFCPLNSYKTSHISPSRVSYGMSFLNTLSEDWPTNLQFGLTKHTPYLALMGELWDVFYE